MHVIAIINKELYMESNFSTPLSEAFTKKRQGATFEDARPKSLLKKLILKAAADCMLPTAHHPCSWNW